MSSQALVIDASVTLPAEDLEWLAVRASGPGGQNVNKVSSKVELRFDLANTRALSEAVKARLRTHAAGRIDREGKLVIASQKTRDQPRNLEDARERLRALVAMALIEPTERKATRPSRAQKARRLRDKAHQSAAKTARRRPVDE
ncbi:MAG: aminoacyl-tRNA hydrolase [Myxococcales bacterium]|nr:aminoacyl-tRNA hydrolase [Myxococcales bacterium]